MQIRMIAPILLLMRSLNTGMARTKIKATVKIKTRKSPRLEYKIKKER